MLEYTPPLSYSPLPPLLPVKKKQEKPWIGISYLHELNTKYREVFSSHYENEFPFWMSKTLFLRLCVTASKYSLQIVIDFIIFRVWLSSMFIYKP